MSLCLGFEQSYFGYFFFISPAFQNNSGVCTEFQKSYREGAYTMGDSPLAAHSLCRPVQANQEYGDF